MLAMFLAGAILAAGGPGAAPEAAKPAAAAKGPAQDDNRIVCRSTPRPGSRLNNRLCLTAAGWRQREQEDREELNTSQRGPQVMMRK
jgi:hypothetical protein